MPSSAGMLARLTGIIEAGSASIDWRGLSSQLTAHGLPGQIEVEGDIDSTVPAKNWLQTLQLGSAAQQVIKTVVYVGTSRIHLRLTSCACRHPQDLTHRHGCRRDIQTLLFLPCRSARSMPASSC